MTKYNKRMFIWVGLMVLFNAAQYATRGCLPVWYGLGIAWLVSFGMFIYNAVKHIKYVKEKN